jgi:hypothetical protein
MFPGLADNFLENDLESFFPQAGPELGKESFRERSRK